MKKALIKRLEQLAVQKAILQEDRHKAAFANIDLKRQNEDLQKQVEYLKNEHIELNEELTKMYNIRHNLQDQLEEKQNQLRKFNRPIPDLRPADETLSWTGDDELFYQDRQPK